MLLPTTGRTYVPSTTLRLAMTAREPPPAQQRVVVAGLDGVLVDSEPATTRCAWQTASRLWPDVMEAAAEVPAQQAGVRRAWVNYDWTALTGEADDGMPSWLSAKLRQLRPLVQDSTTVRRRSTSVLHATLTCANSWLTMVFCDESDG